jgi:hypothetical protein
MLKAHHQDSPTFKSRSQGYPEVGRHAERNQATIGNAGNTANGSGTESTTFTSAWPTRRPMAKSEKDLSTGFAKCITSVSSAGIAEDANGPPDQWGRGLEQPSRTSAATRWTRASCLVKKLCPIGRDTPLRVDQVHLTFSHLHCQKILDRILLLEEPLWECNSRRPALGPNVVQCVGPAKL